MKIDRRGAERDRGELTTEAEFKEVALSPNRASAEAHQLSACGTTATVLISGFRGFGSETRWHYLLRLQFDTGHLSNPDHALHELRARTAAFVVTQGTSRSRTRVPIGSLSFRLTQEGTALVATSEPVPHLSGNANHTYTFTLPVDELDRIRAVALLTVGLQSAISRPDAMSPNGYTVSQRGHWRKTI